MILKRMKRRHNREQILEFCSNLRKLRPDTVFGADIIAGFPTETEEMFQNIFNLIAEAGLQLLHVFPYSSRDNTPAARMPQIEKKTRQQWAQLLRQEGEKELEKFFINQAIGKKYKVIVEKNNLARSENFLQVRLSKNYDEGTILEVEITSYNGKELISY